MPEGGTTNSGKKRKKRTLRGGRELSLKPLVYRKGTAMMGGEGGLVEKQTEFAKPPELGEFNSQRKGRGRRKHSNLEKQTKGGEKELSEWGGQKQGHCGREKKIDTKRKKEPSDKKKRGVRITKMREKCGELTTARTTDN